MDGGGGVGNCGRIAGLLETCRLNCVPGGNDISLNDVPLKTRFFQIHSDTYANTNQYNFS